MPDVFISYSRKNLPFVKQLVYTLEAEGKVVWWDQKKEALEGIIVGSPWWEQIKLGIETADNFLFVISPNSIVSPYCHAEINHACQQGKRLVTALYCGWISEQDTWEAIGAAIDAIPVGDDLPDEVTRKPINFRSLVRQNWLSLNEIQHAIFTSSTSFEEPFKQLVKALDLDFAWVKMHNRLRQAALLWEENGRSDDFLWSHGQLKSVYEMIKRRKPELDALMQEFIKPEQERLLAELEDINTSHQRRSAIGERLAAIGDTRRGVGLRPDGLPDIIWCPVPGGKITIKDDITRHDDRLITLQLEIQVQPFYIAKYPITYVQFQPFLDDKDMGFEHDEWWQGLSPEYQKLRAREQRYKYNNHPRDSISWYQAVAFCRWLTARLPRDAWPSGEIPIDDDWIVRLPMEWEWQQAATGGKKNYKFPWGKEWDDRRANTRDSGIARPTAVGMYPAGACPAPVEALDMSGNVLEWCLNEYENPKNVDVGGNAARVQRGGSFYYSGGDARVFTRYNGNPRYGNNRDYNVGFRVVVGIAPKSSGL